MSTWIKLLDSLHEDPRVFQMGELLATTAQSYILAASARDLFGTVTDTVTRYALRDVTIAGLARVWRAANLHTKDGVFRHASLAYLDTLAQIPGFGAAMAAVGWARQGLDNTVVLPNFAEHNAPDKNGERARSKSALRTERWREKKASTTHPEDAGQPPPSQKPSQKPSPVTSPPPSPKEESDVTSSLSSSQSESGTQSEEGPPPEIDFASLQRRINALRPSSWGKAPHWSSEDETALWQGRHNFIALDDQDWHLLAWFFKWANSPANTSQKEPVKVTTRRHLFVTELPAYLDRATSAWKQQGSPVLGAVKPARKQPPKPAPQPAEVEPGSPLAMLLTETAPLRQPPPNDAIKPKAAA